MDFLGDATLCGDVKMHNMGYKGDVYDTTVDYLADGPVSKCKNKVCNINPGWNEQQEAFMLRVEAGKVKQKLFCELRNEPVRDLNMISPSLNEMRAL